MKILIKNVCLKMVRVVRDNERFGNEKKEYSG